MSKLKEFVIQLLCLEFISNRRNCIQPLIFSFFNVIDRFTRSRGGFWMEGEDTDLSWNGRDKNRGIINHNFKIWTSKQFFNLIKKRILQLHDLKNDNAGQPSLNLKEDNREPALKQEGRIAGEVLVTTSKYRKMYKKMKKFN